MENQISINNVEKVFEIMKKVMGDDMQRVINDYLTLKIANTIQAGIVLIILTIAIILLFRIVTNKIAPEHDEIIDTLGIIGIIVCAVIWLIVLGVIISNIPALMSPEGSFIKEILELNNKYMYNEYLINK